MAAPQELEEKSKCAQTRDDPNNEVLEAHSDFATRVPNAWVKDTWEATRTGVAEETRDIINNNELDLPSMSREWATVHETDDRFVALSILQVYTYAMIVELLRSEFDAKRRDQSTTTPFVRRFQIPVLAPFFHDRFFLFMDFIRTQRFRNRCTTPLR